MMKQFAYLAICVVLFFACSKKQHNFSEIERINVNSSNKVNFTDLFDEWHLIFPETNDASLFGLYIQRIELFEDRIYVLNMKQSGRNLLCFDTNGHFVFNVDRMGQGPREYTYFGDFFIDTKNRVIVMLCENNKWMYLDLDGNYIYEKTIQEIDPPIRYSCEFNDDLYVSYRDCEHGNDDDIVFWDRESLQIKRTAKTINSSSSLAFLAPILPIFNYKNDFFYCDGSDTIYDISSNIGSSIPKYFIDFGKKQRNFKNNFLPKDNNEKAQLIRSAFTNNEIIPVHSLLFNGQYFSITYMENDSENQLKNETRYRYQTLFYDKQTKKTYNTKNINYDIFNSVKIHKLSILGCYNGFFYAVIYDLLNEEELKNIAKSEYLSDDAKKMLLTMDDMSNSIIIKFK